MLFFEYRYLKKKVFNLSFHQIIALFYLHKTLFLFFSYPKSAQIWTLKHCVHFRKTILSIVSTHVIFAIIAHFEIFPNNDSLKVKYENRSLNSLSGRYWIDRYNKCQKGGILNVKCHETRSIWMLKCVQFYLAIYWGLIRRGYVDKRHWFQTLIV